MIHTVEWTLFVCANCTIPLQERKKNKLNYFTEMLKQQKEEKSPSIKTKPKQNFGLDLLNIFNFKGLNLIEEHLIIIAIILLLSIENADEILILALVYILL